MSFAAYLARVAVKRPFWLYAFARDGETAFFTSRPDGYEDDSVSPAQTYTAAPVTHTRFMKTSALGRAETELVFPQSNSWARGYLGDGAYAPNTVTISQGFANDPDGEVSVRFQGRVIAARPSMTRLVLVAENRMTTLRRKAQPAVMQKSCRHALYGAACGVDIATFRVPATLTGLTALTATVSVAAGYADGYFSGGVFTYAGRSQTILRHTGSSLTLFAALPDLASDLAEASPAELSVSIAPGCALTRAVCDARFDNLANFGGFPWMVESPFDGKTLF